MSERANRLASLIFKETTPILAKLKDTRINCLAITDVVVSHDLSVAKIYYRNPFSLSSQTMQDSHCQQLLEKAQGHIRKQLSQAISHVRFFPQLRFIYDQTFDNVERIDKILEKIHK